MMSEQLPALVSHQLQPSSRQDSKKDNKGDHLHDEPFDSAFGPAPTQHTGTTGGSHSHSPAPSISSVSTSVHSARMHYSTKMLRKQSPRQRQRLDDTNWRFFDTSFKKLVPLTDTPTTIDKQDGPGGKNRESLTATPPQLGTPKAAGLALEEILRNREYQAAKTGGKRSGSGAHTARAAPLTHHQIYPQQHTAAQLRVSPRLAPVPETSSDDIVAVASAHAVKVDMSVHDRSKSVGVVPSSAIAISVPPDEKEQPLSFQPIPTPPVRKEGKLNTQQPSVGTDQSRRSPPQDTLPVSDRQEKGGAATVTSGVLRHKEIQDNNDTDRKQHRHVSLSVREDQRQQLQDQTHRLFTSDELKGYSKLRHDPVLAEGERLRPLETNPAVIFTAYEKMFGVDGREAADELTSARARYMGEDAARTTTHDDRQGVMVYSGSTAFEAPMPPGTPTGESSPTSGAGGGKGEKMSISSLGMSYEELALNASPSNPDWAEAVAGTPYTGLQRLVHNCTETFLSFAPLQEGEELPAEDDLEVRIGLRRLNKSLHPVCGVGLASDVPMEIARKVTVAGDKQRTTVNLQHEGATQATAQPGGIARDLDYKRFDHATGILNHKVLPKGRDQRLAYLRQKQQEAELHFGFRKSLTKVV